MGSHTRVGGGTCFGGHFGGDGPGEQEFRGLASILLRTDRTVVF